MDELTGALPAHLTAPRPEEQKAKNTLGKDDFLKLLMVQLQNQDPLNPMDHKEFSAQLAQFGSLEQLTNISSGIDKMHTGMGGEAKLQAVGMIGKTVNASGKEATLVAGEPMSMKLESSEQGRPVKVSIFGEDGKLIREMPVNAKTGSDTFSWDGKTDDGIIAPEGKYTFRVAAIGADGKAKEMDPSVKGEVVGVDLEGNTPVLVIKTDTGKTRITMDKIRNVANESDKSKAPAPRISGQGPNLQGELPEMLKRSLPIARADGAENGPSEAIADPNPAMGSWHSDPFRNSGFGRGR
jgi:flagellar basal-body rod modification protein FlgD